jgi:hypothetical protein
MKISDNTLNVLKNFSTINQSIVIKQGNTLRTISEAKNILAQAVVNEAFPQDFAVYELNQFLGLDSIFEDPDYTFGEAAVTVSEGTTRSRYTYTDPSMVTTPPEKNLELPSKEVSFAMTSDDFAKVRNAANQLQLPNIVIRGSDGVITVTATDIQNPSSNEYSREVGTTDAVFQFVFRPENMKLISDDYQVTVSSKGISHFKGQMIEYWIATEKGSEYNG